jgi:glycosyltransferase involved in cell wall biosynthesis
MDLPHIPREMRGALPKHLWSSQRPSPLPKEATTAPEQKKEDFLSPGVLWEGVFDGWSGYTKLNHEIVHRISNHMHVELKHALRCGGKNADLDHRIRFYQTIKVKPTAPYVRAFGPDVQIMPPGERRRIVFTMMETDLVHPDMVNLINRFDECWVPTQWGADAFRRSGVRLPFLQIPLGVDSIVYRPIEGAKLPACKLVSTDDAGSVQVPEEFIFLTVGLPSIRKGFDVLTEAFEKVFGNNDDVALVCAITHFNETDTTIFDQCRPMKSKIYVLNGSFDEHAMARIYNACDAYVTASRGEGWNLPLVEASACGLPVIVPRHTSHPEVAGDDAFMFHCDGSGELSGSESISKWYKGMPFPILGKRSKKELTELLKFVASDDPEVMVKANTVRERTISKWSWDNTAAIVAKRLLEIQP